MGSTVATLYQAQTNPEEQSSMAAIEAAFTRRFAPGKTVEAALDRLSTIESIAFADLDFIIYRVLRNDIFSRLAEIQG